MTSSFRADDDEAGIGTTAWLTAATLAQTAVLIVDLIRGGRGPNSAGPLLAAGTGAWVANCLVFSLAYWQLDSGGPLARYRGEREFPDFGLTQLINPDLAPPGWRPRYVDYLALGFRPTRRWARPTRCP